MSRTRIQEVRRSKKKSQYLRELSSFLTQISLDEPGLAQIYITRVELSSDGGMCYVYISFYNTLSGDEKKEAYKDARDLLVMYKPSIRKALASRLSSRYVPDLRFVFDEKKEQEHRMADILTKVGQELAAFDEQEAADDKSGDE